MEESRVWRLNELAARQAAEEGSKQYLAAGLVKALELACMADDAEAVKALAEAGAAVAGSSTPGVNGQSALRAALSVGAASCVRALGEAGADFRKGEVFVGRGSPLGDLFEYWVQASKPWRSAHPKSKDARFKAKSVEEKLKGCLAALRSGPTATSQESLDATLCAICSWVGEEAAPFVKALLDAGADPNARWSKAGGGAQNALDRACENLNGTKGIETAKALLSAGADPNAGEAGLALCKAAENSKELLGLLLRAGARPDAVCDGIGAFESLADGRIGAEDLPDCVKMLVGAGADPNTLCEASGLLPLTTIFARYELAMRRAAAMAVPLMAAGADPWKLDAEGDSFASKIELLGKSFCKELEPAAQMVAALAERREIEAALPESSAPGRRSAPFRV